MLYEVVPKALVYTAALVAVGLPVARALLGRAGRAAPDRVAAANARLRRLAVATAVVAVLALALRAWAHTAAAFGAAEAFRWENLQLIALESRWGGAWRWQAIAGTALLAAAFTTGTGGRTWLLYTMGAVALCATLPLLGHAAGSSLRMMVHTTHLLAGGAWLGTLGAIGWGFLTPRAERSPGTPIAGPIITRFSKVALLGSATVAVSGVVLTALYIGRPGNFIFSPYGQTVLAKLLAVAGIVAFGRLNWRRAFPAADRRRARFRRRDDRGDERSQRAGTSLIGPRAALVSPAGL